MRRIQDEADAGKIGAIIKSVMARSSTFSLDIIYGKDDNTIDADEIARIVTEFFALWFNSTDDDDARDAEVAKCTKEVNEEEWRSLASKLNIPWQDAKEVLNGMVDKPISEEARIEGLGLDTYTPSLEEFNDYIKRLNPRSAGGPSGLTYLLVSCWPANVRERVYNAISKAWTDRTNVPGWGRRWLQPIPKIEEPTLDDLRP